MATNINITQITPPRVSLIDERTGAVSREWYRWFYNLYNITGGGLGITPVINGGTGLGDIPTNGQLLIGNGTGYTLNTLSTGDGISVTDGSGTITLTNTGVLSWSGGTTGLTPSTDTTGAVVLSGTLNIAHGGTNTTATPTLGSVVYGTGTAQAYSAVGTTGQALLSTGSGAPVWGSVPAGPAGPAVFLEAPEADEVSIIPGPPGAAGSPGPVGPAVYLEAPEADEPLTVPGPQGNVGMTGAQGGTGPAVYLEAEQGEPGDVGPPGPQGLRGLQGLPGVAVAIDGDNGEDGSPIPGPVGPTGATGSQGGVGPAIYLQADQGDDGDIGPPGPRGLIGPTGSQGGIGPAVYLEADFQEADMFLVQGNQGVTGATGATGATGVQGLPGPAVYLEAPEADEPMMVVSPPVPITVVGILKGTGSTVVAAVANTDYVPLSTVITKTADYTITGTDTWIINNKPTTALTLTFPAASSWTGRYITVKNMQALAVNSASSNIVPIDSTTAGTAILLGVVGNWATMVSDGTNWVIMQAASNNNLLLE